MPWQWVAQGVSTGSLWLLNVVYKAAFPRVFDLTNRACRGEVCPDPCPRPETTMAPYRGSSCRPPAAACRGTARAAAHRASGERLAIPPPSVARHETVPARLRQEARLSRPKWPPQGGGRYGLWEPSIPNKPVSYIASYTACESCQFVSAFVACTSVIGRIRSTACGRFVVMPLVAMRSS
jgi:hypothetical protein